MSDHFSLRMALLDKQIVDCESLPIGRVDDVEIDPAADGSPRVVALLTGAQALGERLGGRGGRWIAGGSARLRAPGEQPGPTHIGWSLVDHIEPMVALTVRLDALPNVAGLERWLGRRVERVPGAGDASE